VSESGSIVLVWYTPNLEQFIVFTFSLLTLWVTMVILHVEHWQQPDFSVLTTICACVEGREWSNRKEAHLAGSNVLEEL
jgi:hypothetical protein